MKPLQEMILTSLGANIIIYDPEEEHVLVIQRGHALGSAGKLGIPGGRIIPDADGNILSVQDAMISAFNERIKNDQGEQVIKLDRNKLGLIINIFDYRVLPEQVNGDTHGFPIHGRGHTLLYKLTRQEAGVLYQHSLRLAADEIYCDACREACGQKTSRVNMIPYDRLEKLLPQFAYEEERQAVKAALTHIQTGIETRGR